MVSLAHKDFVAVVAKANKLSDIEAGTIVSHLFGLHPSGKAYGEVHLDRVRAHTDFFGVPKWAHSASKQWSSLVLERERQGSERAFARSAVIFKTLARPFSLREGFFITPCERGSASSFGLSLRQGEVAGKSREMATFWFGVEVISGRPHFVLQAVQGRLRGKGGGKELAAAIKQAFPSFAKLKGKDWRARAVLGMEEVCSNLKIRFAALNPNEYAGFRPTADGVFNTEHELAKELHHKAFLQAGLAPSGRHYLR